MVKSLSLILFATSLQMAALTYCYAEEYSSGLPELTPEELEQYEFEVEASTATVKELSLGHRYALSTQRREITDLAARRLGIIKLRGDKTDLKVLQGLVDKRAISARDVREWQGVGIVFGDILVTEFGLDWVSYEDELGASKALRWKKTENYVFPVTMFSKRVQFNEKIDVFEVYEKISADIQAFKAFDEGKPVFQK